MEPPETRLCGFGSAAGCWGACRWRTKQPSPTDVPAVAVCMARKPLLRILCDFSPKLPLQTIRIGVFCAKFHTILIPPPVFIGPFVRNITQNLFPNRFSASFCAKYHTKPVSKPLLRILLCSISHKMLFHAAFPRLFVRNFIPIPVQRAESAGSCVRQSMLDRRDPIIVDPSSASFHRFVPRLFSPSPSYRFLIGSSEHSFLRFSTFFSSQS